MKKLLLLPILLLFLTSCEPPVEETPLATYTVTFITNDGSSIADIAVTEGNTISIPTTTKHGYTFTGWFTDSALTESFDEHSTIDADTTLYAQWVGNLYTLRFLDDDGTTLASSLESFQSDLTSIDVPQPTKEGYTFSGWDSPVPETMPAEDVIRTANYTINSYTLTLLDPNDDVISSTTYVYGESIDPLQDGPIQSGYLFVEWDTDVPETMPAHDLVITAIYENNPNQLLGTDTNKYSFYGYSFDAVGDYILVGAFQASDTVGRAYLYDQTNPDFERIIAPSQTSKPMGFGRKVAIQGDYLIINAPYENNQNGSIYIYKISDPTYERRITLSNASDYTWFGYDFVVEDDYLVVNAILVNDGQGDVNIYKLNDETYHRQVVFPDRDYDIGMFGFSIETNGDYLIIGAFASNNSQGRVFIYQFSDESYLREISGSTTDDEDEFGSRLDSYGDYIAVTAAGYSNNKGAVFLYKFSDDSYERQINSSSTYSDDFFGSNILLTDNYLVISAQNYQMIQGAVFIYDLNDETYERKIEGTDTNYHDEFGNDLAVQGDYLFVGCSGYQEGTSNTGGVFVYKFSDEIFEDLISNPLPGNDGFGYPLLYINNTLIIGNFEFNELQGTVHIIPYPLD